jgi:hypothetical protein
MRIRKDLGPCPRFRIFKTGLDMSACPIMYTTAHQDWVVDLAVGYRDRNPVVMQRNGHASYSLFDN